MSKESEDFIKALLHDKKLNLGYLQEGHMTSIAVYNAKRQMLMSDIDVLEYQITEKNL